MGTGIVSTALSLDGHETASRMLLAVDAAIWIAVAVLSPHATASASSPTFALPRR